VNVKAGYQVSVNGKVVGKVERLKAPKK